MAGIIEIKCVKCGELFTHDPNDFLTQIMANNNVSILNLPRYNIPGEKNEKITARCPNPKCLAVNTVTDGRKNAFRSK